MRPLEVPSQPRPRFLQAGKDEEEVVHRLVGTERVERYDAWLVNKGIVHVALPIALLRTEGLTVELFRGDRAAALKAAEQDRRDGGEHCERELRGAVERRRGPVYGWTTGP